MKNTKKGRLNESGQGMSEYLILVMLIAVSAIAATRSVGDIVMSKLEQIQESIKAVQIKR